MGLAAVFVCSVLVGLVGHLDSAAGRRVVAGLLGEALSEGVRGDVAVTGVRRFDGNGVEFAALSARDPGGVEVLRVEEVRIEIDARATARSWLGGAGAFVVAVPRVSVQRAAIRVDHGAGRGGQPAIVEALAPLHGAPGIGGRPLALSIGRFEIGRAEIVGLPARVEVQLAGRIEVAPGPKIDASIRAGGRVGEVRLNAAARLQGEQLSAEISVPRVEPASGAALFSGVGLRRSIAIAARVRGALDALEVEASVTALPREAVALASIEEEGGSVRMRARLAGLPPRWVSAEVEARGIALRDLHEGAPDARVSAEGRAAVAFGEGAPRGTAAIRIAPVVIEGFQVPAVDAWAQFVGDEVQGEAAVRDAAAEMGVAFVTGSGAARLDVRGVIRDLRVKGVSFGALRGRAAIFAAARSRALRVDLGEVRLQGRDIELSLGGATARPLRVTVGRALRVGGDVRIRSGAVPMLGRRVTIEPGLIRLDEEAPGRPHLEVAASYPTSRGSRIRIRYRGAVDLAALGSSW